jgi:hypothetical protein
MVCNLTFLIFEIKGRIFSQAKNELGMRSFLARNELLNDFPLQFVPS